MGKKARLYCCYKDCPDPEIRFHKTKSKHIQYVRNQYGVYHMRCWEQVRYKLRRQKKYKKRRVK